MFLRSPFYHNILESELISVAVAECFVCRCSMATHSLHFMIMNFSCNFLVVFQNVLASSCNAVVKILTRTANVLLVRHCYGFKRTPMHKKLRTQ